MFRFLKCSLVLLGLHVVPLCADDIDIYRPESAGTAYFLLAFDLDEAAFEPACDNLAACQPPYLSAAAFGVLQRQRNHVPEEQVSRLEVLLAVLASALSRPRFDEVQFAVMLRLGEQITLLHPYRRMANAREDLEAVLWSLPEQSLPSSPVVGSPLKIYPEWLRMLQTDELSLADTQCPRFYSMLVSAASAERWADLASPSAPALMAWLHGDQVDFLNQLDERQYLNTSWLVATPESAPLLGDLAAAGGASPALPIASPLALEYRLSSLLQDIAPQAHSLATSGVLPPGPFYPGQVFLPLFARQPGDDWPGNLKKLVLVSAAQADEQTGYAGYVDVEDRPAIEPTGTAQGQIAARALSFWTDPDALPPDVEGADGRHLLLGGAGQALLTQAAAPGPARELYLEPADVANGVANTLVPLNVEQATLDTTPYLMDELAAADSASGLDWLSWLAGRDVDDKDGDGDTVEPRPWLLGALIHSRPAVINYGTQQGRSPANPLVRIFVGSNSGWLHAFENTTAAGEESGRESFAFLPREMVELQRPRRSGTRPAVGRSFYGIDGTPVAWLQDLDGDGQIQASEGEQAWLIFGLRRGGTTYYALDVSDPTAPPVLRWKLGPEPGGDFEELALGFAEVVVGRVQFDEQPRDVVIVAGGYHGGVDAAGEPTGKDAGAGGDDRGNAIFIVDLETGALLWKAVQGSQLQGEDQRFEHPQLTDSFPSAPAVLRDSAGRIYRLYLGDSGGAVWRVDLPPGDADDHRAQHWFVSKLADLNGEEPEADRRFFHPPDLVRSFDAEGAPFDGVLIASGNRAAAAGFDASDGLFYIKDYATSPLAPQVRDRDAVQVADLPDRTGCDSVGESDASPQDECDSDLQRGWRLMFSGEGEKGLSTPLTEAGTVFFTSYVPPSPAERCSGGFGRSLLYRIALEDGRAVETSGRAVQVGEGLPQAVIAVGDSLILPGAGLPPAEGDAADLPDKLLPQRGEALIQLYWREPGRDDL